MTDVPPIFPAGGADDAARLREVLHQAADEVADYLTGLGKRPIFPADPQAPAAPLVPEHGEPLSKVFGEGAQWAIDNAIHVGHPGYVGHMDSGVAVAGILGDFLASALNQNLLAHELAPGATELEKALIQEFAGLAGLPEGAGGTFTPGGTTANLTGLLLARDAAHRDSSRDGLTGKTRPCVLASADAHYSIAKSAAVLGLGSDQVLPVPVAGAERRLDPAALPSVFGEARARGLRPIAVVATAGTTSCGAIDPIDAIADFCDEHGLWLHVDAALGGALLVHEVEKRRLAGIQRSDSITLDPHKALFAPKSCGILLVRRAADLTPAAYEAPYLDRLQSGEQARATSQGRRSIDGSRRFDALKFWWILRHMGRKGLSTVLDGRLALTRAFHQALSEHTFFLPRHLPDLNVQAFAPRDSEASAAIPAAHRAVEAAGALWSSYTRLDGHPCHRVVLLNPSGTAAHLEALLDSLEAAHRGTFDSQNASVKERSRYLEGLLHSSPPASAERP